MAKLDDITIGNYQVLAANITRAYIPYYRNIATAYSDTEKGVGKVIREQQIRMADMLGLLARVEGKGVTPVTRKELKNLESLRKSWQEAHKQVVVWVKESIPFRKDSEKAIKDLGISPKDTKAAADVLKKPESERGGVISEIVHTLGLRRMVPAISAGALAGIAAPMLGPLAGPAAAVAGLGYSGYKMVKGITGRRKTRLAGGDVSSAGLAGMPGAPGVPGLEGMPGIAGTGVVEGIASTYPRDAAGKFLPRGDLTGVNTIEKSLFKFFNVRAMKAKWTRNLLRAIEKRGAADGALGAGLLDSFSKLKVLLPGLLLSLGKGAGLAGAVAFTAYELHRAGTAAKELWEVHKAVSEHTKKMLKKQIGFLDEISTGLAEKMQARQKAGDEPGRKGAFQELYDVEKEKIVLGEKLEREKRGFFGQLAHEWKTGAKGISSDVEKVTGVKKFGDGGVVTKPTISILGEDYKPEVVTPLGAGNVLDILKAIMKNTAQEVQPLVSAPIDTFRPPFDLADPLLNQLNRTGSLSI